MIRKKKTLTLWQRGRVPALENFVLFIGARLRLAKSTVLMRLGVAMLRFT